MVKSSENAFPGEEKQRSFIPHPRSMLMTTSVTSPKYYQAEREQHSPIQTFILHLLPGVLIALVFSVLARFAAQQGLPAPLALLGTWLIAGIPFELAILFYLGRQRNGRLSLDGIVLNREHIPFRQYLLYVPLLLVWAAVWSTVFISFNEALRRTLFDWWPGWLILSEFASKLDQYPGALLWIIVLLSAVTNVAVPIIEELYFRGYLLPRTPGGRYLAPLINVLLFSIYHLWLPWENLARIVILLPVVFAVQWKRNVYISILVHVLLNTLGTIGLLVLVINQGM
jgi:uncharacterized protein